MASASKNPQTFSNQVNFMQLCVFLFRVCRQPNGRKTRCNSVTFLTPKASRSHVRKNSSETRGKRQEGDVAYVVSYFQRDKASENESIDDVSHALGSICESTSLDDPFYIDLSGIPWAGNVDTLIVLVDVRVIVT
jgi:hypothetical protein